MINKSSAIDAVVTEGPRLTIKSSSVSFREVDPLPELLQWATAAILQSANMRLSTHYPSAELFKSTGAAPVTVAPAPHPAKPAAD